MEDAARRWFATRTFDAGDFPLAALAEAKAC